MNEQAQRMELTLDEQALKADDHAQRMEFKIDQQGQKIDDLTSGLWATRAEMKLDLNTLHIDLVSTEVQLRKESKEKIGILSTSMGGARVSLAFGFMRDCQLNLIVVNWSILPTAVLLLLKISVTI